MEHRLDNLCKWGSHRKIVQEIDSYTIEHSHEVDLQGHKPSGAPIQLPSELTYANSFAVGHIYKFLSIPDAIHAEYDILPPTFDQNSVRDHYMPHFLKVSRFFCSCDLSFLKIDEGNIFTKKVLVQLKCEMSIKRSLFKLVKQN